MLPTIKVYEMDYSFLIKNYLNPELWDKTWTLFEYKNFKATLNIYNIQTRAKKIAFDIYVYCRDDKYFGGEVHSNQVVTCSLLVDVNYMKRAINSAIFNAIRVIEHVYFIKESEQYLNFIEQKNNEYSRLKNIAEEFLNDNNITNDHIREAYIEAYTEEYAKLPDMISNWEYTQDYKYLTDLYMVFLNTILDDPSTESRIQAIKDQFTSNEWEDIENDIQEYLKYMETENFKTDAIDNLEEV